MRQSNWTTLRASSGNLSQVSTTPVSMDTAGKGISLMDADSNVVSTGLLLQGPNHQWGCVCKM